VLVIDQDEDKIEEIKDFVTQAISADVTNKKILEEFISKNIDAVVVNLGSNLEGSILTTVFLKDMGIKKILVKARNEDHGKVLKVVGASEIIFPEKDVGVNVAERLSIPNLIDHIPLAPEYSIVEISVPPSFVGKTLRELRLRNKYGIEVIAVKDRELNTFILIPEADLRLEPTSSLIVIAKRIDIDRLKF
jgi:trk system potassium uptake protein TrkA